MIVNFEQINARGEGSRPRVDLNALGELLDGAALGVAMLRGRLGRGGEVPGPEAKALETALIQRAPRSPVGPGPIAAPHAMHQEMRHAPTEEAHRTREGNPADPLQGVDAPGTDLSQVPVEDLVDDSATAGSSWPSWPRPTRGGPSRSKSRRSRPSTPRSSRRSWSVAAGSVSRPTPETRTQPQPPPPARPVVPAGAEGGRHSPGESPRWKSPSRSIPAGWPARGPRQVLALLAGLEGTARPEQARRRQDEPQPPDRPRMTRSHSTRKASPGPGSRIGATPGSPRTGAGRTARRPTAGSSSAGPASRSRT